MNKFWALALVLAAPAWAENLPENHVNPGPVVAPIPLTQDQLHANNLGPEPTQLAANMATIEPAAGPSINPATPAQALKTLQDYLTGYSSQTPTVFPLAVDDMQGPAGDVQYR